MSSRDPADLDHYYSFNDIEVWKTVLGEKMHYHYAVKSKENDPFDQAVIDLFKFIKPGSKILDCGCGWGGPANLIKEKLNCDVTGVTISKSQSEYIKNFPVFHEDLNHFIPSKKYDIAIFIESFTHIINSASMLKHYYNNVDSILIKDFVSDELIDLPLWNMLTRTKTIFVNELEQAGYIVKDYREIQNFMQPALDIWMKNLAKLDQSLIVGHIKQLLDLCHKYRNHRYDSVSQCVIYATRDKPITRDPIGSSALL